MHIQILAYLLFAFASVKPNKNNPPLEQHQVIKQDSLHKANPNAIINEAAFFSLLNLELPQLHSVKTAVSKKNWTVAKIAWGQYLQYRKSPHWLWSRKEKQKIRAVIKENGGIDFYNKTADKFLAREFSFNGVTTKLDKEFNWRTGTPIWEQLFSRHDWMADLGFAYVLTGKAVYAKNFNELIISWVKQHPVLPDVTKTWNSRDKAWMTLEIGLRMRNWMDVMEAFADAPEFTTEARYQMTRSMVEQMRYIDGWMVNYRIGNWQMAEATGMAYVGIMFPEFKEAAAWRQKSFKFLTAHMERDVYADGTHIEVTPSYHIGVTEQCMRLAVVTKANGYTIPGLLDKHQKMFDFVMAISKPDLRYPGLGDSEHASSKNLMGLGALFYNRPDMRYLGVDQPQPGWLWILGTDALENYRKMKSEPPTLRSALLPDSKYAVFRNAWDKNDKYLLFDCAPSLGSHSHGDRLQVIAYSGRDLLIDPGQYSYAEPLVDYFRKVKAHNVLVIDDKEQENVNPTIQSWYVGKALEYVSGKLKLEGISHQRTVVFIKHEYWVVIDHIESVSEHKYTRQFQFPIGSGAVSNDASAFTNFAEGMNLMVYPLGPTNIDMRNMPIPINSTTTVDAPQVTFTNKGKTTVLATVLYPFSAKNQIPKIEQLEAKLGVISLILTFPDRHIDKISVASEEKALELNHFKKMGKVLYIRQNQNGQEEIIE